MRRKQPPQFGPEEFRAFLAWLNPDATKAAEDYNRLTRRLRYFFEGWRDTTAAADELADLSIDRTLKKLTVEPELISKDAVSYVLAVARYILLEFRKRAHPDQLEVDPADTRRPSGVSESDRYECLERCLSRLSTDDYELVRKYHLYDEGDRTRSRRVAAEEFGQSAGTLRVRVFRICRGLQECIDDCTEKRIL